MKAWIRIGRKEGFISSYNLLFDNGLRLHTPDLTWLSADDRAHTRAQFAEVVKALKDANVSIEGEV